MPKPEWTISKVRKMTKKYHSRSEFNKNHGSAYWWARKNGVLNEVFPHLPPVIKRGHWSSKENVLIEAKRYGSRMDFKEGCRQAYNNALKNEWDDVFALFPKINRPAKWDNRELVLAESKKYDTRTEFQNKSREAWKSAKENNWEEVFDHMQPTRKPDGYWEIYENCKKAALKCSSRMEMRERYRAG